MLKCESLLFPFLSLNLTKRARELMKVIHHSFLLIIPSNIRPQNLNFIENSHQGIFNLCRQ